MNQILIARMMRPREMFNPITIFEEDLSAGAA